MQGVLPSPGDVVWIRQRRWCVDRIEREGTRVVYHFVIVDYLCRYRSGEARAASDALDVAWAKASELDRYELPAKALEVVMQAFARSATP